MPAEQHKGFPAFYADSAASWRGWLQQHHATCKAVWLILYRKASRVPTLAVDDAIEEALCFGWIDSKPNKRDADSFYLFFSPRKNTSNWSAVNKKKVEKLMAENRMAPAGLAMVELAKKTGTWNALDAVDRLEEPPDLLQALQANLTALQYWKLFPPSARRGILEWILQAKKPETRQKRIAETVQLAARNIRANQYVKK